MSVPASSLSRHVGSSAAVMYPGPTGLQGRDRHLQQHPSAQRRAIAGRLPGGGSEAAVPFPFAGRGTADRDEQCYGGGGNHAALLSMDVMGTDQHSMDIVCGSGSHTRLAFPVTSLACYGCYRIKGPAIVSKQGNNLVAHLQEGAEVQFLNLDQTVTVTHAMLSMIGSMSSIGEETDSGQQQCGGGPNGSAASASCTSFDSPMCDCVLVGSHVEVGGGGDGWHDSLCGYPGTHHHDGKLCVSVRCLPDSAQFVLPPEAYISHPVNVQPSNLPRGCE